jgi:hypothetical protein
MGSAEPTFIAPPYPTLETPPIETMAKVLLPILFATAGLTTHVATRRPRPGVDEDNPPGGFCRIEAGGGQQVNEVQFVQDLILNTYFAADTDEEAKCERLSNQQTALAGNAAGWRVTLDDGRTFDINDSRPEVLPTAQVDPMVNVTRYRSMVSWTTTGKPIE